MYDYEKKELLEKREFIQIFRTMNLLLENFGDKHLQESQLDDLVDSVFTIHGKIDGCICYEDYVSSIVDHPIIQLSLCVQFQGTGREKLRALLFSNDEEEEG